MPFTELGIFTHKQTEQKVHVYISIVKKILPVTLGDRNGPWAAFQSHFVVLAILI